MLRIFSSSLACMFMFATTISAQNVVDFREALQMAAPATVSVTILGGENRPVPRNNRVHAMDMFGNLMNGQLAARRINAGFAISIDKVIAQLDSDIDEVTVTTIDKTAHDGTVIARDHVTGLCVIEVDDVELVSLVVAAGAAEPGLPVVATWRQDGVGRSHSGMIASQLNASQPQIGFTQHIDSASQLSATGAPIVDSAGVLVGVTVAGSDGGIVCMPSSQLNRLVDVAMEESPTDLRRGMAGIRFSADVGAIISGVSDDSPAAKASLEGGDRVTQVNEFQVETNSDVIAAVAMARSGDAVQLTIQRGDETLTRTLTLADHPQQQKITLSAIPGDDPVQGNMRVHQQAWQLKDGKLVPMDLDQDGGADIMMPRQFQDMFKGLGGKIELPRELRRPRRVDGLQVERSGVEEALRKLEEQKKRQEDRIKELTDKIHELEKKK